MRHLHLDPVGGISGDMFIAAMIDLRPELSDELAEQIVRAGFPDLVQLSCSRFNDGILTGYKFNVSPVNQSPPTAEHSHHQDHNHSHQDHSHGHDHGHGEDHHHEHHHRHYSEIVSLISSSELAAPVKTRALDIFRIIGEAEASIHNKELADIAFHEVGAWDSIADVVCASYLIESLGIDSCSCSKLPLGRGRVQTAHGLLPIPAPATALILEGFEFYDDGLEGERITPTGAGILKSLAPAKHPGGKLTGQGYGFGNRKFASLSNTLRVTLFEADGPNSVWQREELHQLAFEVDDQTPEQLAVALEKLRALPGVLDVTETMVTGKKNRLAHSVRVLVENSDLTGVLTGCFDWTTTLGVREQTLNRYTLERELRTISLSEGQFSAKITRRPGGQTAKAEMDELSGDGSFAEQEQLRSAIENTALDAGSEPP